MKILGQAPPRTLLTKSKGVIVVKVKGHMKGSLLAGGGPSSGVVVQKWPKKRPGALPPITQQQTRTWDDAQSYVRWPEPSEFNIAMTAVAGTAFYTRDILIMAMYGHYISWPGWGAYPQGCLIFPTSLGLTAGGGMKNRPLGLPQPINSLSTLDVQAFTDHIAIDVTTKVPASPELAIWCCDPVQCLKFKISLGQFLPHGGKVFMPCDPTYFSPDRSSPGAYGWDIPCSALCMGGHFAVIQRSITAPFLDWTSLLHDYPQCSGSPPILDGTGVEISGINYIFDGSPTSVIWADVDTVQSHSGAIGTDGILLVTSSPGHWQFAVTTHVECTGGTLTGQVVAGDPVTGDVWWAGPTLTATPGSPQTASSSSGLLLIPPGLHQIQIGTIASGPDGTFGFVRTFPGSVTVTRYS